MLKRPITFEDFEGNTVTEIHWFNLNASELVGLSFVDQGEAGIERILEEAVRTHDVSKIISMYTEILAKSYGIRSEDGKRFIKSPQHFEEFQQTPAFDALIMELCMDENAGTDFMLGVVPQKLQENVARRTAEKTVALPETVDVGGVHLPVEQTATDEAPWIAQDRDPTKAEMASMTKAQLVEAMRAKQDRKERQALIAGLSE